MWPFKRKAPVLSDQMRQEAKRNPNGWVYEIDAQITDPFGEVPPFAIKGAYKVDPNGEITGAFEANKNYDAAKTQAWVAEQNKD